MAGITPKYEISRSTGVCSATGRQMTPGELSIATLCEREDDDGFDRLDFCLEAWKKGERPEKLFSFWQCVVPDPKEKRRVFVDDELLLNLFERLEDDDRPQRIAFRFILALILMRKKILRLVGRESKESLNQWLFLPKGTSAEDNPPIQVIDPQLGEEDFREVSDLLGEILNGELE